LLLGAGSDEKYTAGEISGTWWRKSSLSRVVWPRSGRGDVRRRRWKKVKKIGNPLSFLRIRNRSDAWTSRESKGRVVGNRIRERCFPNGSRLTLVCGRVEGTSESLFFFHPVF